MAKSYRCLQCSKIIECDPYDTEILIRHIKTDHPYIDLANDRTLMRQSLKNEENATKSFAEEIESSTIKNRRSNSKDIERIEEVAKKCPETKPIYTRKYKVKIPLTPRTPQKRRMYQTSIEKWWTAKGVIYCPKCGATKKPIIKSKSKQLSSTSSTGAACILACWPLCFLPYLFAAPSTDYLHCAECHNFLGIYDKRRNCVRPNRDYVEDGYIPNQTSENSNRYSSEKKESKEHSE